MTGKRVERAEVAAQRRISGRSRCRRFAPALLRRPGAVPMLCLFFGAALLLAAGALCAARAEDAASGATLPFSAAAGSVGAQPEIAEQKPGQKSGQKTGQKSGQKPVLTIALVDTLVNPFDSFYLQATVSRLEKALPAYDWRTMTISAAEAVEDIARVKPDFLFAPSGFSGVMVPEITATRIATRKTKLAESADASVGASFVVRRGDGLDSLASLRGKRAASSLPLAIDGWLAAAGEISAAGYDPDAFFESVLFRNNAYPDVISALLAGTVDVAILPACLLETMAARSLIDADGLAVAAEKKGGLACRHSTALYPDVTLLALPGAPETAVRDVTIAILSDRNARDYEWLTNVSFASILSLFERLQLGPYAYLRDMSPQAVFARHRTEFLLAGAALLFLVLNELRLHRLVRRRTRELADSVAERARFAARAEEVRRRLALFERRSIVQQMSGMIAHEINAPIGAIRTYAAVLRMSMAGAADAEAPKAGTGPKPAPSPCAAALEGIEREAVRIAEIVARVRRYARTAKSSHQPTDLEAVLEKSLRALAAERPAAGIEFRRLPGRRCRVLGDALELELLFLNLLRNAVEAASGRPDDAGAGVVVALGREKTRDGERAVVRIENDGPMLDEAVLAELNSRASGFIRAMRGEHDRPAAEEIEREDQAGAPAPHDEDKGLGLGLTICRGIADSHGASLQFEGRPEGGARVVVSFDLLEEDQPPAGSASAPGRPASSGKISP